MRLTGRVKWFNDTKGYGLIHPERGEDVLVRSASIQGRGFKSLERGQVVEFEVVQGPHGPQAGKVVSPGRPVTQE
jgi:CspA family cold shock protein